MDEVQLSFNPPGPGTVMLGAQTIHLDFPCGCAPPPLGMISVNSPGPYMLVDASEWSRIRDENEQLRERVAALEAALEDLRYDSDDDYRFDD